jgi:hypothetical protein
MSGNTWMNGGCMGEQWKPALDWTEENNVWTSVPGDYFGKYKIKKVKRWWFFTRYELSYYFYQEEFLNSYKTLAEAKDMARMLAVRHC